MKKNSRKTVSVRSGNVEFLKLNSAGLEWRDLYHWLLSLSWPRFGLALLGLFFLVNGVFAGLYCVVPGAISGMEPGSFSDAFFFSVESLATVGYGHMYPVSLAGHLLAMAETMLGMFGMAVITGLIFVRFSRPTANLLFSEKMVISEFDGVPALMMRVGNQRHQPMVEAEFKLMMIRMQPTKEGDSFAFFHELPLQVKSVIVFPAVLTIRHLIDESSPLYGKSAEDLQEDSTRFVASAVCIDTVVPTRVQTQHDYSCDDVLFDRRFKEIYTETETGQWLVDYAKLHDTEALSATEPDPSAE